MCVCVCVSVVSLGEVLIRELRPVSHISNIMSVYSSHRQGFCCSPKLARMVKNCGE